MPLARASAIRRPKRGSVIGTGCETSLMPTIGADWDDTARWTDLLDGRFSSTDDEGKS